MPSLERVKDILNQARKLNGAPREEFLSNACGDDPQVRSEVLSLLEADGRPGGIFAHPTLHSPGGSSGLSGDLSVSRAAVDRASSEPPGTRIGRYRIEKRIGLGGMGEVYLADQVEPVRRRVALKIIKPGMDTREVLARFEAERQALAMMDHPSVAKVLDAGATDAGRPYFVMEYVPGEPVTAYCDRHKLPIRARLELFIQVCGAVQHAHQKGIIHRDIKPANILVSHEATEPRSHEGEPRPTPTPPSVASSLRGSVAVLKVIDFGVAKAISGKLTDATVETVAGGMIGTPAYMSPEQAEGSPDIDTRTDVYGLGVLLYELLTGVTPFDAERLKSAGLLEQVRIIREETPPRPSARAVEATKVRAPKAEARTSHGATEGAGPMHSTPSSHRRSVASSLGRQLRGDLDCIVMKCLEKERTRRYETAVALAEDIQRHLDDLLVVAGPPSRVYRFTKLVRRNRAWAIGGSLAGVGLVSAAVVSFVFARGEARQRRMAEESADETKQVAAFLEEMLTRFDPEQMGRELRDRLSSALNRVREQDATSDDSVDAHSRQIEDLVSLENLATVAMHSLDQGLLNPSLKAIRERFHERSLVRAALLERIAGVYGRLSMIDSAVHPLEECLTIRRHVQGEDHAETLITMERLISLLARGGRFERSEPLVAELLERSRRSLGEDDPLTLKAIGHHIGVLHGRGQFTEEESWRRAQLESLRRLHGDEHPDTIESLGQLGFLLREQGKYDEAAPLVEKLLESSRRAYSTSADKLGTATNLAYLLFREGRLAEAEHYFRLALALSRNLFGDDHENTAMLRNNLAKTLHLQGKLREAEPYFRQAMEHSRSAHGGDNPVTLIRVSNLGLLLKDLGALDEAEALLREAWEAESRRKGGDADVTMDRLGDLAGLFNVRGEFAEAEAAYRQVVEAMQASVGDGFPRTNGHRLGWAQALIGLDRFAEAEEQLRRMEPFMRKAVEAFPYQRRWLEAWVTLFSQRELAGPGKGYTEQAAEWRKQLEAFDRQRAEEAREFDARRAAEDSLISGPDE